MLLLIRLGLGARDHVDKIDHGQEERDRTHAVRKARNGEYPAAEQEIERHRRNHDSRNQNVDSALSRCRRHGIVRLFAYGAEHLALHDEVKGGTNDCGRRREGKCRVIAEEQGNRTTDTRNRRADVRNDIDIGEGTVAPLISLGIQFPGEGRHGLPRNHTADQVYAHSRRVTDQAGARDREDDIGQRTYRDDNAQGLSNTEDAVGHIAAHHAADDNQRKVER